MLLTFIRTDHYVPHTHSSEFVINFRLQLAHFVHVSIKIMAHGEKNAKHNHGS
jgi:hypothetical protein